MNQVGPLQRLLRRDRLMVAVSLTVAVALAWFILFSPATIAHGSMAGPFAIFLMWLVMMVAMMLPSAAPMILLYALVRRRSHPEHSPEPAVFLFTGAYLLLWAVFSAAAAGLQIGLRKSGLLDPMMQVGPLAAGLLLVAAGLYQLTPVKRACLRYCRSPLEFITRYWPRNTAGVLRLGLLHGVFCVGCCWALMALLFVGGVMHPAWIVGIALYVAAEKYLPFGMALSRAAAVLLIAAGIWMLADAGAWTQSS